MLCFVHQKEYSVLGAEYIFVGRGYSAVVGAGYIAVELAGVLNALGTDTTLITRKHAALRR